MPSAVTTQLPCGFFVDLRRIELQHFRISSHKCTDYSAEMDTREILLDNIDISSDISPVFLFRFAVYTSVKQHTFLKQTHAKATGV